MTADRTPRFRRLRSGGKQIYWHPCITCGSPYGPFRIDGNWYCLACVPDEDQTASRPCTACKWNSGALCACTIIHFNNRNGVGGVTTAWARAYPWRCGKAGRFYVAV